VPRSVLGGVAYTTATVVLLSRARLLRQQRHLPGGRGVATTHRLGAGVQVPHRAVASLTAAAAVAALAVPHGRFAT